VPGLLATGPFLLRPLFMQVGKYLLNDHRLLDAGDHVDGGAAAFTARSDWDRRRAVCNARPRGVRHERFTTHPQKAMLKTAAF
jgi:hypothetical protein